MALRSIAQQLKRVIPAIYALAGSFIVTAGWGWYHIYKHPKWVFAEKILALWVVVFIAWQIFKILYVRIVRWWGRHPFWYQDFPLFLDRLFFVGSLLFIVFFSQNELFSIVFVSVILFLLFWQLQTYLRHHPSHGHWLRINRQFFILAYFLFLLQAAFQYSAYHYYILDSNIRYFNIVLFRSVAMACVWLLGFSLASFAYWKLETRFKYLRYIPFIIWAILFLTVLIFWVVNVGILYYSGLYFSPVAVEHLAGSAGVVWNKVTFELIVGAVGVLILSVFVLKKTLRAHTEVPKRYWYFYNSAIAVVALLAVVGLTSFRNTPEYAVVKSFYNYYFGKDEKIVLEPALLAKLKKFGLQYNQDEFHVNDRPHVFTSQQKLLPDRLIKNPPNIVIVFWESFSARLNDVYNPHFTDLTPAVDRFASDPHTTVFKNYYNASTPTITGTLAQLCSFLPPTGHNEIQEEKKLQSHHLLCLPEVLKKQAGFKYAAYITAVDKEFAHKDGIFTSAGVDKIFGVNELRERIKADPLSWGYSDHQMFPQLFELMQTSPQPFLMMQATVDSHPPFDLAKDAVNYGDGKESLLNAFHTTDDAFGKFWDTFKQSQFYKNTIVVVVADHAVFPAAFTKEAFPDVADKLTYYDENTLMMYVPDGLLPKEVAVYSSSIDVTPTLLQIMHLDLPNSFEGHSIFDDRSSYPNLLGMHELGLYINQVNSKGKRKTDYNVPTEIECSKNYTASSTPDLTECDYLEFYKWKRQMFEEGRFWKK